MRPSLLLRGPGGNVLVDCTPEMRLQLLRANVMMIEGVIITHTHADHIMGMDDLRSFSLRSRKDMPIYTLPRYQDDIRRIYPYAFQEFPAGIGIIASTDMMPVCNGWLTDLRLMMPGAIFSTG